MKVLGLTLSMYLMVGITQVNVAQQLELIIPNYFIPGKTLPLVLEATSNNTVGLFYSENLNLNVTGGDLENGTLKVKKGRGMASIITTNENSVDISGSGISLNIPENPSQPIQHNGEVNGSETWAAGSVHHITSDLVIGSEDTLIVEQGSWIMVDSAINIIVYGYLKVLGTSNDPVALIPYDNTSDWGGIIVNTGTAELRYTLATGGGGDASYAYGHSGSQATIMTTGGDITMNHCFIFDCSGKGIGAQNGTIQFSHGAISRCDMGGDFLGSHIKITSSHILDIPNDDGQFVDDDNDGFYFYNSHPNILLPSTIDSCVFSVGKDDAVDHNGANLEIKHCWIEGFEHEGIAASNGNTVLVYNTLITDCEQGIEAGYGDPEVTVDHCVLIGNDYGLRFGDWYNWGCSGSILCTNSIMHDNDNNIHNFDVLSNGPIAGAMDITYCITNDLEYDDGSGCLAGVPVFNSSFFLNNSSIGSSAGNDGLDMGLIPPIGLSINSVINDEAYGDFTFIEVYDMNGRLLLTDNTEAILPLNNLSLGNGLYLVVKHFEKGHLAFKYLIAQ